MLICKYVKNVKENYLCLPSCMFSLPCLLILYLDQGRCGGWDSGRGWQIDNPIIFFKSPNIQSDLAFKSESDVDILRGVGDALSTPIPLTSYKFTF